MKQREYVKLKESTRNANQETRGQHQSCHSPNRVYPENTNFETVAFRNLKFHTFGDLHITKKS